MLSAIPRKEVCRSVLNSGLRSCCSSAATFSRFETCHASRPFSSSSFHEDLQWQSLRHTHRVPESRVSVSFLSPSSTLRYASTTPAGSKPTPAAPSSSSPPSASRTMDKMGSSPSSSDEGLPDADPFAARDPKLDLQSHLIADAQADTRHFMEQSTFKPPLESAISTQTKEAAMLNMHDEAKHTLPHPVWSTEAVYGIQVTHFRPENIVDRIAYVTVKGIRAFFDFFSGYSLGRIDERGWLNRICYLETIAGVPGMVGAMIRHLNSLRRMERDYGWIHTLLEEAENERMHLMTALVLKKPSYIFRSFVLVTQAVFLFAYTFSYIVSRKFAHRLVGYLEEEAVVTYTKLLKEIDHGHLPLFENLPAPPVARDYWCLSQEATFRDVILAIRADEAHHREVNHTFADLHVSAPNPFPPGH